jgi:hypothetical protein
VQRYESSRRVPTRIRNYLGDIFRCPAEKEKTFFGQQEKLCVNQIAKSLIAF